MSDAVTCRRAMSLATGRQAGLSEADALRLEQHVAGCPSCAEDLAVLDRLGRVGRSVPFSPGSRLAGRALTRALAGERPSTRAEPRMTWRTGATVGLVAAAAALLLATLGSGASDGAPSLAAASGHAHATAATRVSVAHGVLDLEPGADVAWTGAVVVLREGRLRAAVDPAPHLPFRVETARFAVHVTGTRFEVDGDSVAVTEGSVDVRTLEGELLATLRGGQRWELLPEVVAAAELVEAPSPASLEHVTPPGASDAPARAPRAPRTAGESASASARFAHAATLERSAPDEAARLYEALEAGGGAWAQNALFARASLALSRGRSAEATTLLERYLALHPGGPNAPDARALLGRD